MTILSTSSPMNEGIWESVGCHMGSYRHKSLEEANWPDEHVVLRSFHHWEHDRHA